MSEPNCECPGCGYEFRVKQLDCDEELEQVCEFIRQRSVDAIRCGNSGDSAFLDALVSDLEAWRHRK